MDIRIYSGCIFYNLKSLNIVVTWNYMRGAAGASIMAGRTGFACSSLSVSDWWKVLGKHYGGLLYW